ncbi:Fucolectin-4 [Anabarilius grahami]|uniref:Fucolectin-4 n=1 Tax=Anabarilius grahami TaxID=495550 RepID=A0A3N0XEQ9_ANAGA|nr:Fucolectin-4 [Anabarilius grahami]
MKGEYLVFFRGCSTPLRIGTDGFINKAQFYTGFTDRLKLKDGAVTAIMIPVENRRWMAIRVIVFLTLTGLCVAHHRGNLAFGGTAVQSSTYDQLTAAHNAVDGNRNSDYHRGSCSHTKGDRNPWWRVDLLNVYSVTRVSITNRGDCCAERINGAQIRIGNSLENYGNNNQLAATVVSIPLGQTKTFEFKPINGRYVNISIPGRYEYLTLCEVEVFARNLAFGGTAVQSSTYDHLTAAQNAVDGNRNSDYHSGSCSHTNADWDPWWRVDLLNVYKISRVVITNRGDCCPERLNGAQIRIGNSLENNGNNNQLAATVGPIPPGETRTFKFHPIKGRYVNIFIPWRTEHLTLCELEVFSEKNKLYYKQKMSPSTFIPQNKKEPSNRLRHQLTEYSWSVRTSMMMEEEKERAENKNIHLNSTLNIQA